MPTTFPRSAKTGWVTYISLGHPGECRSESPTRGDLLLGEGPWLVIVLLRNPSRERSCSWVLPRAGEAVETGMSLVGAETCSRSAEEGVWNAWAVVGDSQMNEQDK